MTRAFSKLILAAGLAGGLTLAGCGSGMYSQTADQVAAVPGYSRQVSITETTVAGTTRTVSVGIRNATFAYPGPDGYRQGESAPIQVNIFNDTVDPITVTVQSSFGTVVLGGAAAQPTTPSAEPSPAAEPTTSPAPGVSPSAEPAAEPTQAPVGPATVTIPPGGYVDLGPDRLLSAALTDLTTDLRSGDATTVVRFVFSRGGQTIATIDAPLGINTPVEPGERAGIVVEGGHE